MKNGMVIVHYNDYKSLSNLISNVKDYNVLDRIIIVDNNSPLQIKDKLMNLANEKISVVLNDQNLGFAHAINEGAKKLIQELSECNIIISNSDIVIRSEADLKRLIELINSNGVGVVAPTIQEPKNITNRGWKEINSLQDGLLNIPYIGRKIRKNILLYDDIHYQNSVSIVDVVSGCFFLIKSKILEKIDYFDEKTFLYYEENILAKKIKNLNLKILVANDVKVKHNHSVSIDKNLKKIQKLKIQKQSQYYFHKYYNNANILERIFLKTTALLGIAVLRIYYLIKDMLHK